MLKALLWKEWRENRTIILGTLLSILGVSLIFYLALRRISDGSAIMVLYIWFGFILIPTFAAGIAANMFNREKVQTKSEYLFELPISKSKIWWTKVGLGISMSMLICIVLTILLYSGSESEHWQEYFFTIAFLAVGLMLIAFSVTMLTSINGTKSGPATFYGVAFAIASYLLGVLMGKHIHMLRVLMVHKLFHIPDFISVFLLLALGTTIICSIISYLCFRR
jgi:ABC-type transport system involved in multi-copper enzyme maturation permease subunit